jgi:hypothetical protein
VGIGRTQPNRRSVLRHFGVANADVPLLDADLSGLRAIGVRHSSRLGVAAGAELVGIDPSERQLATARRRRKVGLSGSVT